ncbi:crocetin glucosyltransferase 3, partial [Phtheirospermum japonicum]
MAQGHIIPFLSLALKLEQQTNYTITFINTPLNINKLKQTLPQSSNIRLLEIPFDPTKHGLPLATETTETLTAPLIRLFIESSAAALKPAFKNLISSENNPPLCIISDMFFAWTAEIAHEFNALHAVFNAGGGFGMAGWAAVCLNTARSMESNPDESGFYRILETKNLSEMSKGPWKYGQE